MTPKKTTALGSDEAAVTLRHLVAEHLQEAGYTDSLYGPKSAEDSVTHPDVAVDVARQVAARAHDRAVLMCGTGIGMPIAATSAPGIVHAWLSSGFAGGRSVSKVDKLRALDDPARARSVGTAGGTL